MLRKAIVAGNWKMQGSKASATALLSEIKAGMSENLAAELIVFPPFVYLEQIERTLQGSLIAWGAQNLSANETGAFTGEIAATMLNDFNCRYVLVGHSERRTLYNEDDVLVAMKFAQAQRYNLTPVLCVGETLQQREQGETTKVVSAQLDAVLNLDGGINVLQNAVIAYEPVWAIGTGLTASPEQAQEVHGMIREKLSALNAGIAANCTILYGGSVKSANAKEIFAMPDIDGGLIGGASLNAQEFLEIAQCIK